MRVLLEQIAGIDEDSDKALEPICNVFIQTTFAMCECFNSFVNSKSEAGN